LSKDQKEAALTELPSLIEMFSHCFFIGGYLVGPQFSMKKYQNYIRRNIEEDLVSKS
jgi:lysophospholipid acyltransferase 5